MFRLLLILSWALSTSAFAHPWTCKNDMTESGGLMIELSLTQITHLKDRYQLTLKIPSRKTYSGVTLGEEIPLASNLSCQFSGDPFTIGCHRPAESTEKKETIFSSEKNGDQIHVQIRSPQFDRIPLQSIYRDYSDFIFTLQECHGEPPSS